MKKIYYLFLLVLALTLISCKNETDDVEIVRTYTINFYDGDILLEAQTLEANAEVIYKGPALTKEANLYYEYEFEGWLDESGKLLSELPNATKNAAYYAKFAEYEIQYEVKWLDEDGTVLEVDKVGYGSMPTYDGKSLSKLATNEVRYEFKGWDKEVGAVTENVTYQAVYQEIKITYTAEWICGGKVIEEDLLTYGEIPSYDGDSIVIVDGIEYTILGWDKEITSIQGNIKYLAITKESFGCYATFIVEDESLISYVLFGEKPIYYGIPYKEASSICTYEFVGWRVGEEVYTNLPEIAENTVFTAEFTPIYKTINIKYVDEYGVLIHTAESQYGQQAPLIDVPSKDATAQYTYEFVGWMLDGVVYKGELPVLIDDSTFKATYSSTINNYCLEIKYIKNDAIFESLKLYCNYGDTYQIDSPVIEGYTPNHHTLSGVIVENLSVDVSYLEGDLWDGSIADSFAGGEGTAENPYQISTAAELAYLAQLSNAGSSGVSNSYGEGTYYILTNDINLANIPWTPISYAGGSSYSWKYFGGYFDGNDKIITGLYFNDPNKFGVGLFGGISGTVVNLKIEGSIKAAHRSAGLAYYLNEGTVENVVAYVNVTTVSNTSDGCYTAGLLGTSKNSIIKNCKNYGNVSGVQRYVAGIVGTISSGEIKNCSNYANILGGTDTYSNYIAGIAGNADSSIVECENYGFITGKTYVAGIVGRNYNIVKKCNNYGVVDATGAYSGGIVGDMYNDISECINYADIYSSSTHQGGVVGRLYNRVETGKDNTMSQCINYGKVNNSTTSTNALCGGVVGNVVRFTADNVTYNSYVKNVTNYGDVNCDASFTGAVVGSCNGGDVSNSINYGNVYAGQASYVGGIAGSNYNYGSVNYCVNYGLIIGGDSVGQICGQLTSTSVAIGNVSEGKTY